jgi:hypothetical protein
MDSNRRPLLTIQARTQLVATGGNDFRLFEPFLGLPICHQLPLVAPALLHKCSIRGSSVKATHDGMQADINHLSPKEGVESSPGVILSRSVARRVVAP